MVGQLYYVYVPTLVMAGTITNKELTGLLLLN